MSGRTSAKTKNAWIAKAYDRINLTVAKGKKEIIQSHAQQSGESVNGFINRAIDHAISGAPSKMTLEASVSPPLAQGVVLPSNTLEAVRAVSETTRETLGDYVTRAVDTQVVRDRQSLRMGVNPATGERISKGGNGHE